MVGKISQKNHDQKSKNYVIKSTKNHKNYPQSRWVNTHMKVVVKNKQNVCF